MASQRHWSRSDTVALANARCANCMGTGLRRGRGSKTSPCGCVLRNLFRAVLGRYQREGLRALCARPWRKWSRAAEFRADVFLVSLGNLTEQEQVIFREFFIADKPWYAVAGRAGLDRGNFFHAVYRIEERLGRLYAELQPFSLFPTDSYFLQTIQRGVPKRDVQEPGPVRKRKWWLTLRVNREREHGV